MKYCTAGRRTKVGLGVILVSLFFSAIATLLLIMNPLELMGDAGTPQSCFPAPLGFLLWVCVFQWAVCVHQETCVCQGWWGGPAGLWPFSAAASFPLPVQIPAPSVGSLTGPAPLPDSPGCSPEHGTPGGTGTKLRLKWTKGTEISPGVVMGCRCVHL